MWFFTLNLLRRSTKKPCMHLVRAASGGVKMQETCGFVQFLSGMCKKPCFCTFNTKTAKTMRFCIFTPPDVAQPTTGGGISHPCGKMADSHRDCVVLSTRLLRQIWGIEQSVFYHVRKISQKVVEPNWFILLSSGIFDRFFKKLFYIAPVKKFFPTFSNYDQPCIG